MVEWKTEKDGAGTEIFNLYLSHHYQEPKVVATLWRAPDGHWLYTCPLTNGVFEFLYDSEICEHDAKLYISEKVYEHFASEVKYSREIMEEFEK
jgi:hypothetical protein